MRSSGTERWKSEVHRWVLKARFDVRLASLRELSGAQEKRSKRTSGQFCEVSTGATVLTGSNRPATSNGLRASI